METNCSRSRRKKVMLDYKNKDTAILERNSHGYGNNEGRNDKIEISQKKREENENLKVQQNISMT